MKHYENRKTEFHKSENGKKTEFTKSGNRITEILKQKSEA